MISDRLMGTNSHRRVGSCRALRRRHGAPVGPTLLFALLLTMATPLDARQENAGASAPVAQFYSYRLRDRAAFEQGYRQHLRWHAERGDPLAWYAWTVSSGPRRGIFIDGTAGATFAQLDDRPDPEGDRRDFARAAGREAEAIDVETWELWPEVSTATPLEQRRPGAYADVYLVTVQPARETAFRRAVTAAARGRNHAAQGIAWYRKLRGGAVPAYMVFAQRQNWSDLDSIGRTLPDVVARSFSARPDEVQSIIDKVETISTETWTYEPRLSLLPGLPLSF